MKLTKSKDERVRLGALSVALDRGFGKPTQHLEAQVSVYDSPPRPLEFFRRFHLWG